MKTIKIINKPEINNILTVDLDGQQYQAKIIDKNDSHIICEIDLGDCIDTFTFKYELVKYVCAYNMILTKGLRNLYLSPGTEIELIERFSDDKTFFGRFKRLKDNEIFCLLHCQVKTI